MPCGTSLNLSTYLIRLVITYSCYATHTSVPPVCSNGRHFSKFNWDASCDISCKGLESLIDVMQLRYLSLHFAPKGSLYYILPTSHMWYNVTNEFCMYTCDHFFILCIFCVRPSILSSSPGDLALNYWFTRFCSACIAHLLDAVRQRNPGSRFYILRLNINSIKGVDH